MDWNSVTSNTQPSPRSHHLAGGVDWNLVGGTVKPSIQVTTLRVVWIEIPLSEELESLLPSPPCGWCGLKSSSWETIWEALCHHLAGGVDWNLHWLRPFYLNLRHHLAGGVDWNTPKEGRKRYRQDRHHLAGGVDWNITPAAFIDRVGVTTLRVVWIEIKSGKKTFCASFVTTLRVVWIEIYLSPIIDNAYMVTTLRVVWIEILDVIIRAYTVKPSPPCGWCGLKLKLIRIWTVMEHCHHLAGGVDWNS